MTKSTKAIIFALRGFAYLWLGLIALLYIATIALMTYDHGVTYAWRATAEWFSPFNVMGWIANVVASSPALIAYSVSEAMRRRATAK